MSDINSIIEIRRLRDEIREKINTRDKSLHLDSKFGSENEYTFSGLIGGISALLTDISTLTKAPNRFIKLSTYNERQSIIQSLNYVNSHFNNPGNYLSYFESLKSLIRSYNLRFSNERHIEFEKEIDDVLKMKLEFEETLIEIKAIKDKIESHKEEIESLQNKSNENLESLDEKIEEVSNKKEEFSRKFEDFENTVTELELLKTKSSELLDEIVDAHNESVSNEKVIVNFSSKVSESDEKLIALNNAIKRNDEKLVEYNTERTSILEEATSLIESAKKALNYKTAEGISASFQNQYEDSIKFRNKNIWIVLASICLSATVGLGIWIITSKGDNIDLNVIITRISLLPFPIFGAIFCTNQYSKQKNIIEDYAYKMVIAKSIVGFSEQLKKNGSKDNSEYMHYIKTALEEIHKDPLRARNSKTVQKEENKNQNIKEVIEIAEKIAGLSK